MAFVFKQLGCPYSYGSTGPCSVGFDCSGLMMRGLGGGGHHDPAGHLQPVGGAAAHLRVRDPARRPAVLQRHRPRRDVRRRRHDHRRAIGGPAGPRAQHEYRLVRGQLRRRRPPVARHGRTTSQAPPARATTRKLCPRGKESSPYASFSFLLSEVFAMYGTYTLIAAGEAGRGVPAVTRLPGPRCSGRQAGDGGRSTLTDAMRRTLIVTNDFPPRQGGIQSFVHELALRLDPDQLTVYAPKWDGDAAFDAAQPFEVVRHPTSLMIGGPSVRRRAAELARSRQRRGGHLRRLGPPGADHAGAPQGRACGGRSRSPTAMRPAGPRCRSPGSCCGRSASGPTS